MPELPAKLPASGTLSVGKFRKTLEVMRQAHTIMLSQASLLKSVFPPGVNVCMWCAGAGWPHLWAQEQSVGQLACWRSIHCGPAVAAPHSTGASPLHLA